MELKLYRITRYIKNKLRFDTFEDFFFVVKDTRILSTTNDWNNWKNSGSGLKESILVIIFSFNIFSHWAR